MVRPMPKIAKTTQNQLADTLEEFARKVRQKRGRVTVLILEYNNRITHEICEYGERHQLGFYFGLTLPEDTKARR